MGEWPMVARGRVVAVDRLRGLLVLLAVCAAFGPGLVREWTGEGVAAGAVSQLEPTAWHGVALADLLLPGFLFVMGVSARLSVDRRRNCRPAGEGEPPAATAAGLLHEMASRTNGGAGGPHSSTGPHPGPLPGGEGVGLALGDERPGPKSGLGPHSGAGPHPVPLPGGAVVGVSGCEGDSAGEVFRHLLWRCAALFLIGLVLDGGVFGCGWINWSEVRWVGPWQQIAVCNLCVGTLCLVGHHSRQQSRGTGASIAGLRDASPGQPSEVANAKAEKTCQSSSCERLPLAADWKLAAFLAAMILVNYGVAFELFPAPAPRTAGVGRGAGAHDPYTPEGNIAAAIDRAWLPGRKYFGDWDPQGILTTLPALAVALCGAAAGEFLGRHAGWRAGGCVRGGPAPVAGKACVAGVIPVLVAVGLLNGGLLLAEWQPLNAWLLTSPFVLVAVGVWGLALAGFALVSNGGQQRAVGFIPKVGADRGDEPIGSPGRVGCQIRSGSLPGLSLAAVGRNPLVLMVGLSLFSKIGPAVLDFAATRTGISGFDSQTFLAAAGIVLLAWGVAWLSHRNAVVRL